MRIDILTLFPEMFNGILTESILKRAIEKEIITINLINFRDFSTNKHRTVDDTPYGGGQGMLLSVEPLYYALTSIDGYEDAYKILLSPQGYKFDQDKANELKNFEHLILICGHYEGFDERIRKYVDEEISIGDYVLTGGEVPAMVIIDSVSRLVSGVLGHKESYEEDSFQDGLLEYPQYTRPYEFLGEKVPDVLISGNHQEIDKWRKAESLKRTKERRPDLLNNKKWYWFYLINMVIY